LKTFFPVDIKASHYVPGFHAANSRLIQMHKEKEEDPREPVWPSDKAEGW